MAGVRVIEASQKQRRDAIPSDQPFGLNIDYNVDANGGICYECGSNIEIQEDHCDIRSPQLVQPGGGGTEYQYIMSCPRCGLEEEYLPALRWYAVAAAYDAVQEVTRSNAAWKAWFTRRIQDIIHTGVYPRWLRTGRPAPVPVSNEED